MFSEDNQNHKCSYRNGNEEVLLKPVIISINKHELTVRVHAPQSLTLDEMKLNRPRSCAGLTLDNNKCIF